MFINPAHSLTFDFLNIHFNVIIQKQLWDTASTSSIEILERFQTKALHMIVGAPWCRIRLSKGISKYQQLNKKSATTALNTVLASAHTQMT
jgi:hypothetical protein